VHVFSSSYGLYVSYNVHTISKKAVVVKGYCGIEDPQKLPISRSLRFKHDIVVLNDSSSSGESCDGKHSGSPLGLEFAVGEKCEPSSEETSKRVGGSSKTHSSH
jgi:hypothetical protein